MDLALNNLKRLICHKPKEPPNQPSSKKLSASSGTFNECTATAFIFLTSHWVVVGVTAIYASINPKVVERS